MAKASYTLRQPHRINGVLEPAGAGVRLPEQLGNWLVAQGVCTRDAVQTSALATEVTPPRPVAQRPPQQWRAPIASRCCGR